jgi:thiol-disulfide isomerase/thioredoxin
MHKSIILSAIISAFMMTVCTAQTTQNIDTTHSYRASFFEKMPANNYSRFFKRFKYKEIKFAPILRGESPTSVTIVMGLDSSNQNHLWAMINYEDSSFTFQSIDDVKISGKHQLAGSFTFQLFRTSYDEYTIEFIVLVQSNVILFRWVGSSTLPSVVSNIPIAKPTQIKVGKSMKSVSVNTLADIPINLGFKNDSVTVINWWSTTCPPCVEEIPGLNKLAEMYKGEKVKFIAIAWNNTKEVSDFLSQHPFAYQHCLFNDSAVNIFGNTYPRHVIINSDGNVVYDKIGGDETTYLKIESELKKILAGK